MLKDSKLPADRSPPDQGASSASGKDTPAAVHQAWFEGEPSWKPHTVYVIPDEPWHDPGLRGTAGLRQQLVQSMLRHGRTIEPLPSAQSLSRYVRAFLDGFHERYPLFHRQTMPLADLPADVAFSLLAVGADSCLESKAAIYLFGSAVAVSPTRLGLRQDDINIMLTTNESPFVATRLDFSRENAWLDESSHVLCILLLLTVFTLENRSPLAMQAMWSVQGVFAHELRQSLISLPGEPEDDFSDHPMAWSDWARCESRLRVKHAAFCVLNLVSIIFDFPAAVPFAQLRRARRRSGVHRPRLSG